MEWIEHSVHWEMDKDFFMTDQNDSLYNGDNAEFGFTNTIKDRVLEKLRDILAKYKRLDLLDATYTVVKELVINATKAIMKRIVFAENKLDIDNVADWEKGNILFKERLLEKYIKDYIEKGKSLNFKVKVRYVHSKNGIRVEVINNTPIPKLDEERLRKNLANSMRYDSIADFYLDCGDNVEGAGLGLPMIIILLKNQGIDPQFLRIGNNSDETIARIEIPFNKNYLPFREQKFKSLLKDGQI